MTAFTWTRANGAGMKIDELEAEFSKLLVSPLIMAEFVIHQVCSEIVASASRLESYREASKRQNLEFDRWMSVAQAQLTIAP
jgi:hypothetical protein